ncbi:hypothetical protein PTKIN_Ptkin16aG0491300 [Pterospermum kingtungense]
MDEFADTFHDGLGYVLGNGKTIQFWTNEWIPGCILKYKFPRIFALAVNKTGKVREFGHFVDNKWCWNIVLRRRVFGWESEQWNNFLETVQDFFVCDNFKDKLIWKSTTQGVYTPKAFSNDHLKVGNFLHSGWKMLWTGLVPPKVESFCWQLLKGRVAVKDNLVARNVIHSSEAICSFCGCPGESINHIFFSCYGSWCIWTHWCKIWGIKLAANKDAWSNFIEWQSLLPTNNVVWKISFCAILWSIWLHRNEIVFKNVMALATVSLKLLVDSTNQRVLFAEAGKDFADFLFNILSLPVGTWNCHRASHQTRRHGGVPWKPLPEC